MKKLLRIIGDISLALFALISCGSAIYVAAHHVNFVRIVSNSMAPQLLKGDVVVVRSIATPKLTVGTIAVLPTLSDHGVYFAHRIISIRSLKSDQFVVKTKGDANPIEDDWSYTITSSTVPVYLARLPTSELPDIRLSHQFTLFIIVIISALLIASAIPARRKPL